MAVKYTTDFIECWFFCRLLIVIYHQSYQWYFLTIVFFYIIESDYHNFDHDTIDKRFEQNTNCIVEHQSDEEFQHTRPTCEHIVLVKYSAYKLIFVVVNDHPSGQLSGHKVWCNQLVFIDVSHFVHFKPVRLGNRLDDHTDRDNGGNIASWLGTGFHKRSNV
ncbi:hypothetical protein BDU57DRAFT_538381 [Ampelomyces quisqualis]|uniref:Uncharacterized protein n=1 Tax=Ampelomyces quisqualis TaxID=50730 RepID=A0A6A5QKB6_AMPQU|nr:hypothetical protein BDU57DRAFT_538381 [Ampelomyces quisqualis]